MFDIETTFEYLSKTESCTKLSAHEIINLGYKFYKNSPVWKIETEITFKGDCKQISLYLNFPNNFPYSIPKVFISKSDYEGFKYVPHINDDLSICIFDEGINNTFPIESANEIVEYIVHQAKEIIKNSEDNEYLEREFKREFKAYWELEYKKHDKTSKSGLHLLNSLDPELIKGIRLKYLLNGYEFILYNEGHSWDIFKKFLEYHKLKYDEINVFLIDNPFTNPPFDLTFNKSTEILSKTPSLYDEFKRHIKKNGLDNTLVAFTNENTEVYGWCYRELLVKISSIKGSRKKPNNLELLNHPVFGRSNVLRIVFDNLTYDRLQLRTSGVIEKSTSLTISGLGSVGSNLIHFLKNFPVNKFHLIDDESLKLENINRHYLGFNYINNGKAPAIKDLIINSNPFCEIETENRSIQDVITENPEFINDSDFHIVCIGETMIENYILNSILERKLTKPIFLFWVEPFLASGQMLFINPFDVEKAITLINNYRYNVLLSKDSNKEKTYLKEGSCQTGYFPYSSTYLIQFLSAIFPNLKSHIIDGNMNSTAYTWIGDKDLLGSLNLEITDFATSKSSYELIINPI